MVEYEYTKVFEPAQISLHISQKVSFPDFGKPLITTILECDIHYSPLQDILYPFLSSIDKSYFQDI